VTFHAPPDPAYVFAEFYRRVRDRGFILYPGKLTTVDTFRVGCIGAIGPDVMKQAVAAVAEVLREMGVHRTARSGCPASAPGDRVPGRAHASAQRIS